MSAQAGDVALIQTFEGPDLVTDPGRVEFTIEVVNGLMTMTPDFDTAIKLSLFGGEKEDDGSPGNPATWWGNLTETSDALQYRSRTQYLLNTVPATSGNLKKIEDAARLDLAWFLDTNTANSLDVSAIIPALNRVTISGTIRADGIETKFSFTENWKAGA